MDAILDTIWQYLALGFRLVADTFFLILQQFHFLGPVLLISLLALGTIVITKLLTKLITTKRYVELEEKFNYWVALRDEAMHAEDRDKGKRMARNIDQAELNRAYYDYFFEGFMLSIARRIIPIFFMFAFINEYYRTENLTTLFGQSFILQIPSFGGEPVLIGAVFWYILSLFIGYLGWFVVTKLIKHQKNRYSEVNAPLHQSAEERSY